MSAQHRTVAAALAFNGSIKIVIPGAPRTKKNHGRVVRVKDKPVHLPSDAWRRWRDGAILFARAGYTRAALAAGLPSRPAREGGGYAPLAQPVNCAAWFYRDAETGDAVGYYQGLADLLQEAGVVADDKWIVSWDDSRMLKDAHNPRVEVTLSW